MNQKQFTKLLASKTDLSVKSARKLVGAFGDSIETALKKGERVVYSNFGSFYLVNYPSKTINHPAFGNKKKTIMLATNAVKWMPSDNIKDLVDHHLKSESATSFGSTKKINAAKKSAGFDGGKAIEITEAERAELEKRLEEELLIEKKNKKEHHSPSRQNTVEIPIRVIKKGWLDLPFTHVPLAEKEIVPFAKKSLQIKYLNLSEAKIPENILCLIPEKLARRTKVVPVDLKDEILILGMADPHDHDTIAMIKKIVGKKISPHLVSASDLEKIFAQYGNLSTPITPSPSSPISHAVNLILKRAISEQATTIHFDPDMEKIVVRFRINGGLVEKTTVDKSLWKLILAEIKQSSSASEINASYSQYIFSANIDGVTTEFGLLIVPAVNGEKIIINTKPPSARRWWKKH